MLVQGKARIAGASSSGDGLKAATTAEQDSAVAAVRTTCSALLGFCTALVVVLLLMGWSSFKKRKKIRGD